MSNQKMAVFKFFLSILLLSLGVTLQATEGKAELQKKLSQIDAEIHRINAELPEHRRKAFNREMNAQPFMLDDWNKYAKTLEEEEKEERWILHQKQRIDQLEEERQALINQLSQ